MKRVNYYRTVEERNKDFFNIYYGGFTITKIYGDGTKNNPLAIEFEERENVDNDTE